MPVQRIIHNNRLIIQILYMRFSGALVIAGMIFLSACKKEETATCNLSANIALANPTEVDSLRRYITTNNINAVESPQGFFYSIQNPGSGTSITPCSMVVTTYSGKILQTGRVFDETGSSPRVFTAGQLIDGAKAGLLMLKKGGSIQLYIPPSLGYGSIPRLNGPGDTAIKANAYLQFDFQVTDVK